MILVEAEAAPAQKVGTELLLRSEAKEEVVGSSLWGWGTPRLRGRDALGGSSPALPAEPS